MANGVYDAGIHAFMRGDIIWKAGSSQTFKAVIVDTASYSVNFATHVALSDISVGMRVATTTVTPADPAGRSLDATDLLFPTVAGTITAEALAIYKDTGVASTSTLLFYIDTAVGLPITTNGTDIVVQWDNTTPHIWRVV